MKYGYDMYTKLRRGPVKVQADWVSSVGTDGLEKMLARSIERANQSFAELTEPTESQQALKDQLDKIDKEINPASHDLSVEMVPGL